MTMRSLVAGTCIALSAACAHTEEKKEQPAAAATPAPEPTPAPAAQPSGPKTCTADTDCGDKQLCIRGSCVDISLGLAECREMRAHFGFNDANVQSEDKQGLERIARCLRADQVIHVTIEGNADERGTEEYNLHLGDKRATAIARYLEGLGVSETQLKTVSYGKDNPLCREHDEACWAKNRRASVKPKDVAGKSN
jgi:peptidoglycan-associated lipoprotein